MEGERRMTHEFPVDTKCTGFVVVDKNSFVAINSNWRKTQYTVNMFSWNRDGLTLLWHVCLQAWAHVMHRSKHGEGRWAAPSPLYERRFFLVGSADSVRTCILCHLKAVTS